MSTIKATSVRRDGEIIVEARVLDAQGKAIVQETYRWGDDVPVATIVRETRMLLKNKLAQQEVGVATPVAGLDGETV